MGAVLALRPLKCEVPAMDWEQWFMKGAESLKAVVKNVAQVVSQGGTLQEMSAALWQKAPDILSPVLEAALQARVMDSPRFWAMGFSPTFCPFAVAGCS